MAWNPSIKAGIQSELQSAVNSWVSNMGTFEAEAINSATNNPGAQGRMNTAKASMEANFESMQRVINRIKGIVNELQARAARRAARIAQKEGEVRVLSQKVQEETVLSSIRQEQVNALRKKYASNLHSSWLGLWRPLDETSRFGILVAAIAFGCIAVLAIVYLWKDVSTAGSPAAMATSVGTALFGGFRGKQLKR